MQGGTAAEFIQAFKMLYGTPDHAGIDWASSDLQASALKLLPSFPGFSGLFQQIRVHTQPCGTRSSLSKNHPNSPLFNQVPLREMRELHLQVSPLKPLSNSAEEFGRSWRWKSAKLDVRTMKSKELRFVERCFD